MILFKTFFTQIYGLLLFGTTAWTNPGRASRALSLPVFRQTQYAILRDLESFGCMECLWVFYKVLGHLIFLLIEHLYNFIGQNLSRPLEFSPKIDEHHVKGKIAIIPLFFPPKLA